MTSLLLAFLFQISAAQKVQVFTAANKLMPGVSWKQNSVVGADFTCRGRTEYALMGTVKSEAAGTYTLVAVFVESTDKQLQLITDMARDPTSAKLTLESLNSGPEEVFGHPIRGFERSDKCKGLNLADGEKDSLHIFWNHVFHDFDSWTL